MQVWDYGVYLSWAHKKVGPLSSAPNMLALEESTYLETR